MNSNSGQKENSNSGQRANSNSGQREFLNVLQRENNSNISNSQIIADIQNVSNQINCVLGNPENNSLEGLNEIEPNLQDLVERVRQRVIEIDRNVNEAVVIDAEINQARIEELHTKILKALDDTLAAENYDTEKVKMLMTAVLYLSKAQIFTTKNINTTISILKRFYTALCSGVAWLDPDTNRVIALIEAGISMVLITNQVTPWLSPFLKARHIINTVGVGLLMIDASKRCVQTGSKLSVDVYDAVSPLIVKAGNVIKPACKYVADCTLSGYTNFKNNTRTGRAISRGTQRVFKSSSKMLKKAKKNAKKTAKIAKAAANEVVTGVDRMGRGAVRMVLNPKQTFVKAYNLCKNIVDELSSPTCKIVGLETGQKSSSKHSSSSVASSAASIASEEAQEIIENVFRPNARELLNSAMHPM